MSRKLPNHTMPSDLFCRHNLELSFRLLRSSHPLLADAVRQALDCVKVANYADLHAQFTGEMLFNRDLVEHLSPQVIGKIVAALTQLGRTALQDQDLPGTHMAILRTLIEDWVALTEWILNYSSAEQGQTSYH